MKKTLMTMAIVASLGLTLCFTGCGPTTPEEVAVAYNKELQDFDFDGAAKYASKDSIETLKTAAEKFKEESEKNKDQVKAIKESMKGMKVEVDGKAEIDGDKATVMLKATKDGKVMGTNKEKLVKEDGKWKVVTRPIRF